MTKRKSRTPLKSRKLLNKEETAEDYCFFCKDGGELVICDYGDCLKAYHLHCIETDNPYLKSKQTFRCDWHNCRDCKKAPGFYCYFCPKAFCIHCISDSEFVNFKGKYGFCTMCLKVVLLLEEGKDVDSDGEKVDFEDYETREALLKEYYKNYKNQPQNESFSVDALRAAKERLDTGKNILSHSNSGEFDNDTEDGSLNSDSVSFVNVMEHKPTPKKKKLKAKPSSSSKHGGKSKGLQFCGWGSKPLLNFLKEMGKDTEQKMSRFDVASVVSTYVKEHNLQDSVNKKNILCDEKLCSIFGMKAVKINRIYALLGAHFAENREESSEEDNSFENDDMVPDSAMRSGSKSVKSHPKKKAQITAPSSATNASVSKHNINLVYLRGSVVQELSKHPSSFETKIIGCFVRVKADPDDIWQKNSHQLVQVTGVKRVTTTGDKSEICLCVTNSMLKVISLSLLSDGDISEEEVEDLRQRMKDGQIQQPTMMELQKKADILHQDITKDWIVREVKRLTIQIDRANEKGRRKEMSDYLYQRSCLESPSEQSRLLETYPTVIPEAAGVEEAGNEGENHEASPPSNDGRVTPEAVAVEEQAGSVGVTHEASALSNDGLNDKLPDYQTSEEEQHTSAQTNTLRQTDTHKEMNPAVKPETPSMDAKHVVIYLDSSDDEDTNHNQSSVTKDVAAPKYEDPEEQQWMIMGPDQKKRGPFPVSSLKQLIAASSYALKAKVWKENQNEGDAITLEEAVRFAFPAS